ncbi:MAG TPA: hypothetical protein VMZ74_15580 [Ramlibacter sp.]|nr:hypothetical protein [Ramlibacter sp.]
MRKSITALLLAALVGCASTPQVVHVPSACELSEASYECQVERYKNVND